MTTRPWGIRYMNAEWIDHPNLLWSIACYTVDNSPSSGFLKFGYPTIMTFSVLTKKKIRLHTSIFEKTKNDMCMEMVYCNNILCVVTVCMAYIHVEKTCVIGFNFIYELVPIEEILTEWPTQISVYSPCLLALQLPVSYTHLDVYKRQPMLGSPICNVRSL